jgi:hypothetical protein
MDCKNCMQRQCDKDQLLTLLGKFPPYHGPGYNYTKEEVENWLEMAKATLKGKAIIIKNQNV